MRDRDIEVSAGDVVGHYWRDLWDYRELFGFLAWRDVKVRYKQTVIGIAWSVVRPLLVMVVLTIVFDKLAKCSSGDVPYPILVYTGMIAWQFFADALTGSSNSVILNAPLVSKVYFPRIIIPSSAIIVCLIDTLIAGTILIILMAWYDFWPDWRVIALPFFAGMLILTSLGAGYLFSSLNVYYRDFKIIVPFIVQFGLYISPVGFSSSLNVPEQYQLIYSLNPMVGIIEGFRWSLLGGQSTIYLPGFFLSFILIGGLFLGGIWVFRRMERDFADII